MIVSTVTSRFTIVQLHITHFFPVKGPVGVSVLSLILHDMHVWASVLTMASLAIDCVCQRRYEDVDLCT